MCVCMCIYTCVYRVLFAAAVAAVSLALARSLLLLLAGRPMERSARLLGLAGVRLHGSG